MLRPFPPCERPVAWRLVLPVGIRYESNYFRGRPHGQLIEEHQLRGLGELSLDHHRERQNH